MPVAFSEGMDTRDGLQALPPRVEAPEAISLDDRLKEVERTLIAWALRTTAGNKSKAAALLKVKRSTFGDRINRCGIGTGAAYED